MRQSKRGPAKTSNDGPNQIDVEVGLALRCARLARGFSQADLADALGITFQQVQKYERGANRVSASKLYEIARILSVPLSDFFEGLPPTTGEDGGTGSPGPQPKLDRLMDTRDGEVLAELFPQIEPPSLRRAVVDVVRALVRAK